MVVQLIMRIKRTLSSVILFLFCLSGMAIGAEVGQPSPGFQIKTVKGDLVDFQDLKGEKPVFLVFWATWCVKCREEVADINDLYAKLAPKGMEFLAVDVGVNDSVKKVEKFIVKYKLDYPVAFDKDGMVTKVFGIQGTPTLIIIDKKGIIRYKGPDIPKNLESRFSALN